MYALAKKFQRTYIKDKFILHLGWNTYALCKLVHLPHEYFELFRQQPLQINIMTRSESIVNRLLFTNPDENGSILFDMNCLWSVNEWRTGIVAGFPHYDRPIEQICPPAHNHRQPNGYICCSVLSTSFCFSANTIINMRLLTHDCPLT